MIHDLLDYKKKTLGNSTTRNIRGGNENKVISNHINLTISDSDNKEARSSSTGFIPPWLRNSLGLNQRNNQNLDWSVCLPNFTALDRLTFDQKSPRIIPKYKEENCSESDNLKENTEQDSCAKTSDLVERAFVAEVNSNPPSAVAIQSSYNGNEKLPPLSWSGTQKGSETESAQKSELKILPREESITTNTDIMTSVENDKIRDEERKRLKLIRQKHKIRKRLLNEHRDANISRDQVDLLLEMKAREVLDNYVKKDLHSVSSDMKQLEAKLILLSGKCQNAGNSKLSQQELKLLQEIKVRTGNQEEFDRLMKHVRESNLKEIFKGSESRAKTMTEVMKKDGERDEKVAREILQNSRHGEDRGRSNPEKDLVMSTDDEDDIKRFSEFLSKNKNIYEKRKCLEEVRNYFEKKRRARLTRRRYTDDCVLPKTSSAALPTEDKDEPSKEKLKNKDSSGITSGREKRTKAMRSNEEAVEKAVNETLQKFVNLYHFRVSPTLMGSMRKNILQAIQSDSLDSSHSKHNSGETRENTERMERHKLPKPSSRKEILTAKVKVNEETKDLCTFPDVDSIVSKNIVTKDPLPTYESSDIKKSSFKTLLENSGEPSNNFGKENDVTENENIKLLKNEFENFLNSVQSHADVTGLKLQSIVLDKEEFGCSSKNVQFVYNFITNELESTKKIVRPIDDMPISPMEHQVQTEPQPQIITKNVKCQTARLADTFEKCLQTDEKEYATKNIETEVEDVAVKELKNFKSFQVLPGLYRMVKSKTAGKFYLYPENFQESKPQFFCKDSNSTIVPEERCEEKLEDNWEIMKPCSTITRKRIPKEKEKRKVLSSKKSNSCRLNRRKKLSKKDTSISGTNENSLSCLYFRGVPNKLSQKNLKKEETLTRSTSSIGNDLSSENLGTGESRNPAENIHLSCTWFWNGKKIGPGSDLKNHVEDLLMEKLKEILTSEIPETPTKLNTKKNNDCLTKRETYSENNCQDIERKISEKNLGIKMANAIFCFRNELKLQKDLASFAVPSTNKSIPDKNKTEEGQSAERESTAPEVKAVRNAATQNSQQPFLSLNITKLSNEGMHQPKSRKPKQRRPNFVVKQLRRSQENIYGLKKKRKIIEAVRKLEEMKWVLENSRASESTRHSSSTLEESSFSSVAKSHSEDPLKLLLGMKNKRKVKSKYKNILSSVGHESQRNGDCTYEEDSARKQTGGHRIITSKQWELIEDVLSRVGQTERESLWSDIREFLKTKIGCDINEEGAREVCIEIEQDIPEKTSSHDVVARGHYVRHEGDVEVEIDLTLEDLERILRSRQKEIQRKQMCGSCKLSKPASSSSAQSDPNRRDFEDGKCQQYLQTIAALGDGFLSKKDYTMLKKYKDN